MEKIFVVSIVLVLVLMTILPLSGFNLILVLGPMALFAIRSFNTARLLIRWPLSWLGNGGLFWQLISCAISDL